jgi:HEAT repeat protein
MIFPAHHRHLLATALMLNVVYGCKRPTPITTSEASPQAALAAPEEPSSEPSIARPSGAAPVVRPSVATLLGAYLAASAEQDRREVLWEIFDAPPTEAVPAIARLLVAEKRADLRIEMLDSLDGFDGQVDAKLAILTGELIDQPAQGEVREAALDALLNLQDRRAIPLWKKLAATEDAEVIETARSTIKALESIH